jgi:hypothetical protein
MKTANFKENGNKTRILRLLRILEKAGGVMRLQQRKDGDFGLNGREGISTCKRDILRHAVSEGLIILHKASVRISSAGQSYLCRAANKDMAYQAQHGEIFHKTFTDGHESFSAQINSAESPLARLYHRKDKSGSRWLDDNQFQAGERLRQDFERAGMQPRLSASWDLNTGAGGGAYNQDYSALSDFALDSRKRVDAAIAALDDALAGVVLDICCYLKGLEQVERERQWPARSAKLMLRTGLAILAMHYGFIRRDNKLLVDVTNRSAAGYRPQKFYEA